MKLFYPKFYVISVNCCEILELNCKNNMLYTNDKSLQVEFKGSDCLPHNVVCKLRVWGTCTDAKAV